MPEEGHIEYIIGIDIFYYGKNMLYCTYIFEAIAAGAFKPE